MDRNALFEQSERPAIAPELHQALALHQAGQIEEAIKTYLAILQTQPAHAEANYNLGLLALQTQHFDAALTYLNAALDADPTCGKFWVAYIDTLSQAGLQADARSVLEHARQQGLQGEEVETLAGRLGVPSTAHAGSGAPASTAHVTKPTAPPTKKPKGKKSPPRVRDLDALVAAVRAGKLMEAESLARTLAHTHPQHDFAWKTLGVIYMQQGRCLDALAPMKKAAALSRDDVEVHHNLGVAFQALERLDDAVASYRNALRIDPRYVDALCNLGVVLRKQGKLEEAEQKLRKAVQFWPSHAESHNNLAATLKDLGKLEEAEASCRMALQLQPQSAAAHNNLGIILDALDRMNEAEASYRKVLAINPDDAQAHSNLGLTLQKQGKLNEANGHSQIALHLAPEDARAHENRGNLLCYLGRATEAEACYRNALRLAPDDAVMHANLGRFLRSQRRFKEAEPLFRQALEICPDNREIRNNLGLTLQELGRLEEAETCYQDVLRSKSDAGVISNLAQVLQNLGRIDEAEASFRQAVQISPGYAPLHSNLLHHLTINPSVEPKSLFLEHVRFSEQFESALRSHWPKHANTPDSKRRLQVGFVSADFNHHAVASFIEPVLAQLCTYPGLSLHAYYNNFVDDQVTQRLRGYFARWTPTIGLSDTVLADKVRADGIDILIDLSGHTAGNRLPVFARKPAPVQATWMGYPGTTGMVSIDYFLGDRFFLPPGKFDDQFTEKIAYLPANSPYLPDKSAPPINSLPALRNGHLTFGSFNRPNKLSREVIALWSRLLQALPNARILLGAMPETGQHDKLATWFAEEGVSQNRIDFHPRANMGDYMKLYHKVDICLDTFPYNGGTTTLHSLWMGVPTLTLAGTTAAGRSGASILGHVGLEDFVAHDSADFLLKGVSWAGRLAELADIRAGLRERFARSAQGQPAVVAAGVACALRKMWQRWCAGLPAESFEISLQDTISSMPEARA